MKKLFMSVSICTLLLLAACGNVSNPKEIASQLQKEKIQVQEISMNNYFKLGFEQSVESAYKLKNDDHLLVYVFSSQKEVAAAKKQLESQFKLAKTTHTPSYYTAENVLIVHLAVTPNEAFSNQLKAALNEFLSVE